MFLPHARRWPGIAFGVAVVTIAVVGWHRFQTFPEASAPRNMSVAQAPGDRPSTTASLLAGPAPGARNGQPWEDIPRWDALTPRDRLTTLLAKPFCLLKNGRIERLELARDELFIPRGPRGGALKPLPLQADAKALMRLAEQTQQDTGITPELVFYPPQVEHTEQTRRILTDELLLHASAPQEAIAAATATGCEKARVIEGVSGYVIAKDQRLPGSTLLAAADLSHHTGIDSALPMLGGALKKMSGPNDPTTDPFFKYQWHLKNTRQVGGVAGNDANVTPVWKGGLQGGGVVIGILDDGLQTEHPDLSPNFMPDPSYDFLLDEASPDPQPGDNHGTCVAGVAAAAGGNGIGVSGVAPQASLAGLRMLGAGTSDATEMLALGYRNDLIAIKNCSWGLQSYPAELYTVGGGVLAALHDAATLGRGGKGVILTFAAGNDYGQYGLQGNKAGFPSSIYVCAVGAVNASGVRSYYSEFGAHLLTCAPSSGSSIDPMIVTTDRTGGDGYNNGASWGGDLTDPNYTEGFSGTSAATAVVSGVVALMLEANPQLGWRDVKEILLRSGTKLAPTDPDWVSRSGGNATLPPIKHNHQYGGGMINAVNAVNLASTWTNLGDMGPAPLSESFTGTPQNIPDYNATGITVALDFTDDTPTRVEQVEVVVDMQHTYRGDVSIDLVSPAGTISHLAVASVADSSADGYAGYTFSSARHWGESSVGVWKVIFRDLARTNTGTVSGVTINLYGVPSPPTSITLPPQDLVAAIGGSAAFNVAAAGAPGLSYQWSKGTTKITGGTSSTYVLAKVTTANAGSYSVQVSNLTGLQTRAASLGVVDTTAHTLTFNESSTLVLQATAAGPGILYQWTRNGSDMNDDTGISPRITGTHTSKLTVKNIITGDADVYACRVTVGSASLYTGGYSVTVRVKPQIADFEFPATIVSGNFLIALPITVPGTGIDGFPTTFTITGLPSGLTYYPAAGVITGSPNVNGTFTIKITASNAAGSSVTVSKTLTIKPLAATVMGTFNGLVAPDIAGNSNLGGSLNIVTKTTGTFTGRLTLGPASYALAGRLVATVDAGPSAALSISRGIKPLPLHLLFTIDPANGHLTGTVDDTLNGRVDDAIPTFKTAIEAWQNPYSTTAPAGPIASTYNAWIDPPADSPGTVPQGASYGTLVVSQLGTATWTGTLADGTAVTRSTTIGLYGDVPLQLMLYANTGSFQGWLNAALAPGCNTLTGSMDWVKNPQPTTSTTRSYKGGFLIPALTVTGSQYVKPTGSTILWGLTSVNAGANNAVLTFADGGLSTAANATDLNGKAFRVISASTVQLPQPNPTVLKLAVDAATGRFNGSATLKDSTPGLVSRPLAFSGVIVSNQAKGRGFFTLSQLPNGSTSPILSGAVELVAPPTQ